MGIDVLVKFAPDAGMFDFVRLADFLEEAFGIRADLVPAESVREEL